MGGQEDRVRILLDSYAELRRQQSPCGYLGDQIAAAYSRKLKLDGATVLQIMQAAVPVCYNGPAVDGPVRMVQTHVAHNGWTPELSAALRSYLQALEGHTCGCCRDARRDIRVLLFTDEASPAPGIGFWSDWMRSEYRSIPEPERFAWRPLFVNFQATMGRPSKAWIQRQTKSMRDLGLDTFASRVHLWLFSVLHPAIEMDPLGSNLLRNLAWCCTLAPDERFDAPLEEIAMAIWPQKAGMDKALKAVDAYLVLRPSEAAAAAREAIRKGRSIAPLSGIELVKGVLPSAGIRGANVRRLPDQIEIHGDLGAYVFTPSTQTITDLQSGAVLNLDYSASSPRVRLLLSEALKFGFTAPIVAALLHQAASQIRLNPQI